MSDQPNGHDATAGHDHDHGALGSASPDAPLRVLFVCWGNSARSIIAEALLRHLGGGRIDVFSAGIEPKGVNPLTVRVLEEAGLPTTGLRSKPVSDDTRDVCPVFPGVHESLHWGYPDPAKVEGSEDLRLAAFRSVFTQMGQRIHQFLPIAERFAAERRPVELA